jgi:DNA polymerase V
MTQGFGDDFEAARAGTDGQAAPRPRDPIASSGFGSPGSDFTVKRIDFNDALIRHPQATFVMRMSGDAMRDAGILEGDVLVVDRAVSAAHGHIVIAKLDGELACRRLVKSDGIVALESAELIPSRDMCNEERPLEVWGVVTFVIHPMQL